MEEEQQPTTTTPKRCAHCRRALQLGVDLWAVEQGVMGPRGVVPLGQPRLFCCEACVGRYYDGDADGIIDLPRRIP